MREETGPLLFPLPLTQPRWEIVSSQFTLKETESGNPIGPNSQHPWKQQWKLEWGFYFQLYASFGTFFPDSANVKLSGLK